jgi:molybdate transport system substrate-binding protein
VQIALLVVAALVCNWCRGAEITVISTVAVQGLLEQVRTSFEHSTGNRLHVEYGTSAVLKRQLEDGGSFDVAILTQSMINDLARNGKVDSGAQAVVARSGVGLAAKKGTHKPSIVTRQALRRTLSGSSGIAYTKEGQSGAAAVRLFEALGIAETMKDRIYLDTRPGGGVLAVADGKAPIGIALMSEIAANPNVSLIGPLPGDLQSYVVFSAGAASSTKEPQACRAFISFLGGPEVRRRLQKLGMEAGK